MSLRKTMASLTLAGALAAAPTLALGQAQHLEVEAPPGKAVAEGAGSATAAGATAAAVAAGLAVAAAVAQAIAAARGGDRTGTTASQ